jgi:hypothetical protein
MCTNVWCQVQAADVKLVSRDCFYYGTRFKSRERNQRYLRTLRSRIPALIAL